MIRLEKKGNYYEVFFDGVHLGNFIRNDDGYYVFAPNKEGGVWGSYEIRQIADKLDEVNKEWDDHLNDYYNKT